MYEVFRPSTTLEVVRVNINLVAFSKSLEGLSFSEFGGIDNHERSFRPGQSIKSIESLVELVSAFHSNAFESFLLNRQFADLFSRFLKRNGLALRFHILNVGLGEVVNRNAEVGFDFSLTTPQRSGVIIVVYIACKWRSFAVHGLLGYLSYAKPRRHFRTQRAVRIKGSIEAKLLDKARPLLFGRSLKDSLDLLIAFTGSFGNLNLFLGKSRSAFLEVLFTSLEVFKASENFLDIGFFADIVEALTAFGFDFGHTIADRTAITKSRKRTDNRRFAYALPIIPISVLRESVRAFIDRFQRRVGEFRNNLFRTLFYGV